MSEADVPICDTMSQATAPILSPEQLQAIQLLVAGKSNIEVAQAIAKERRTISRWKKDPRFLAAINEERKELYEAGQIRLYGLLGKAIDVIEQKLDEGNFKAATEVLRIIGLNSKPLKPDFETDPEIIAAREAERMAWNAYTASPFARDNMGIGARQDRGLQALANDIFAILKEKYQITTEVEELLD